MPLNKTIQHSRRSWEQMYSDECDINYRSIRDLLHYSSSSQPEVKATLGGDRPTMVVRDINGLNKILIQRAMV